MRFIRLVLIVILIAGMPLMASAADFTIDSDNPILSSSEEIEYVSYPDSIINVLLMGIDFGSDGYWGSGYKSEISECHTDAVLVVAINITKQKIDIISLPRDTVTLVPGVRGVYKLNGAVNCADTVEEGLEKTKQSVEWLLGGIAINCYFAVDMNTMFTLGDAIGGVDFYMDMEYVGSSGTTYYEGWQHLDGTGIMDYVRARTNATVDGNDLGRARRQRDMMTAVLNKLIDDSQSLSAVLDVLADETSGFFSDLTTPQAIGFLPLIPMILSMDEDDFTSYSLDGSYRTAMQYNFTFTDQDLRQEVIQAVYGIEVDTLPYVSYAHSEWLTETGFSSAHTIAVAAEFKAAVEAMDLEFTEEIQEAWDEFNDAYDNAIDLFETSAETLDGYAVGKMKGSRVTLRNATNDLAELIDYEEDIPFNHSVKYWYEDTYINEYDIDWR